MLLAAAILAGVSACEDSLGIDDYEQKLLKGDTLDNIDTRHVTTFDTTEIDKIIVRDSIFYRDSVVVTYDTIYVRLDTTFHDLKIDFAFTEFYELYDPNNQKHNFRWFPNTDSYRGEFQISYASNKPKLSIDLYLDVLRADFKGNQTNRTEIVKSVRILAEIDNFPGYNDRPVELDGDTVSTKYSNIKVINRSGNVSIYDGAMSPLTISIFRNDIFKNEVYLIISGELPSNQTGKTIIFTGNIVLHPK